MRTADCLKHLRASVIAFTCALCVAATVCAASGEPAFTPLNPQELAAVVGEIDAMVKTDESQVHAFAVREATPARIDRLYRMPELLRLDKTQRENGLILAGHSPILRFEKPSDILAKVSAWFPGEIAAARAAGDNRFFGHVDLWGPYPTWGEEQTAFLTLWNCMPQIAWLRPDDNPFMRRLNDGLPLMAIAARSSNELDFGHCVRERSGLRPAWSEAEIPVVRQEVRDMAGKAVPVLQRKFARFLNASRCEGSGPDDCVLILLLWASLTPADPDLASAVQALEADVSPTGPLPALQKPADPYDAGTQEGEPRFDALLRKAAFMRAKLLSLLHAPDAWPSGALRGALHQLTRLQQTFVAEIDHRRSQYALEYYNEPINPWPVLASDAAGAPQVQAALMAELTGIGDDAPCAVFAPWFEHGGESLQTAYVLQRLTANRMPRCANPDWAWLQQGQSEQARQLRDAYLALPGHIDSGAEQDWLLSGLTDQGERCFDAKALAAQDWLRNVCSAWISEPQTVQFSLEHSRLRLGDAEAFVAQPLEPPPTAAATQAAAWLDKLAQDADATVGRRLRAIADDLDRRGATIYAATRWSHAGHATSLIELQLAMADPSSESAWPFTASRMLVLIAPHDAWLAGVPHRFAYQYDEGEITRVSDLDADGHLEVWLSGTFGECDGEDLRPGVDCAVETLHMGEIRGDALSYFANTPRHALTPNVLAPILGLLSIAAVLWFVTILRRRQ